MIRAARDIWTDAEIWSVLQSARGSQLITFRFDVLRGGVRTRSISATGEVTLDRFADIQRTARFELYEALDWLKDEIKPYMLLRMDDEIIGTTIIVQTCAERDALNFTCAEWDALNMTCAELDAGVMSSATRRNRYAEFPLGVFILSTPTRTSDDAGGLNTWQVEAYDHTIILEEDCIVEPLFLAAGISYLDAIQAVLVSAGIDRLLVRGSVDTAMPSDRVFEIGTSKRAIVNTLLREINFDDIYCDADGVFILSAYVDPSVAQITSRYAAGELSIIGRGTQSSVDYYKTPNVFIAMCDNPDLDETYISVWTNDNPVSPFSTVQRGRTITSDIYQPDAIASQDDLDTYIRRIAFDVTNERYEHLSFTTALNPLHERAEVLNIQHPDVSGIFIESGWTFPLYADGTMSHEARRLVIL